jgi:hypothetical protein
MSWCVVDEFGFAWGDVVETLEEAEKQLRELRADTTVKLYNIQLEIERRS